MAKIFICLFCFRNPFQNVAFRLKRNEFGDCSRSTFLLPFYIFSQNNPDLRNFLLLECYPCVHISCPVTVNLIKNLINLQFGDVCVQLYAMPKSVSLDSYCFTFSILSCILFVLLFHLFFLAIKMTVELKCLPRI